MTENKFQAKLLKKLRSDPLLQDAVIFKHSDMINGGIPDVSVTLNGVTTWFELKVAPRKLTKLQEHYFYKIGHNRIHVVTKHPETIVITNDEGVSRYCDSIAEACEVIREACEW